MESTSRIRRIRRPLALTACAAALAFGPTAAMATDGGGQEADGILAQGTSAGTLRVTAKGPTDVVVREITIPPGGSTGWHTHAGQIVAVVRSGTLTRTLSDCSVQVSPAGTSFVEPSGERRVHLGRNLGSEPVVLYATYLLPKGSPLSEPASPAACPEG